MLRELADWLSDGVFPHCRREYTVWTGTKVAGKTYLPWTKYGPKSLPLPLHLYMYLHIFSVYTYIFYIHTYTYRETRVSSKQAAAFWKGWEMAEERVRGIAARIAESKPCAALSDPAGLPPLYVWGFAASKNCGQIEGLARCAGWLKGAEGLLVRGLARSRWSFSCISRTDRMPVGSNIGLDLQATAISRQSCGNGCFRKSIKKFSARSNNIKWYAICLFIGHDLSFLINSSILREDLDNIFSN